MFHVKKKLEKESFLNLQLPALNENTVCGNISCMIKNKKKQKSRSNYLI